MAREIGYCTLAYVDETKHFGGNRGKQFALIFFI